MLDTNEDDHDKQENQGTLYSIQEKLIEQKMKFNKEFDDTMTKFATNMDFLKW